MTLVVARVEGDRVAIAADTMTSASDLPSPMQEWVLKSICLPGGICVSYSNSPELAARAFQEFRRRYAEGTSYEVAVAFFEASSTRTGNDYIVASAKPVRLTTIRGGRRLSGLSKTHWIGDKEGFERFREYEHRHRNRHERGRAVNAVMFADELSGSPASDLYSVMRNIVLDRSVPTVGGFVTILSNRDSSFRFSVYSDVLFDWPVELGESQNLQLTDKIELQASGENDRYSVSQISPGYYDANAVAFYVIKGRLLVVFYETSRGLMKCISVRGVEPDGISAALDKQLGLPFRALCLVMSARECASPTLSRATPEMGLGLRLYCEVNTMR